MFHVLSYVRPFAFPRWAFRVIRVIRTFRIFRIFQAFQVIRVIRVIWFFLVIRTMLRAAIWHEKRG